MKILLLLVNQWLRTGKTLTFWKPKANNSFVAQEIMTKLHVHYSIITYITQNKIHGIWSIDYLNHGYIDPTGSLRNVSDANRLTVDPLSGDFVCNLSYLGSAGGKKKSKWPVLFRSANCLWDLAKGLDSTDRLSTIGRSFVDSRLTLHQLLFLKWVTTWLTVSRSSGDSQLSDSQPSDSR